MRKDLLLTPKQMSDMEKRFFAETGTKSIDLMECAAGALVSVLIERFGINKTIFFACGPGGNGGDGLAAARLYKEAGGSAAIVLSEAPKSCDAKENYRRAIDAGVRETAFATLEAHCDMQPDIWVDALFGTGLSRAPEGAARVLIARMNADRASFGRPVIAVDIPSGLSGLSGSSLGLCVIADITVTFQLAKTGHYLNDGLDVAGEVLIQDIGIPASFLPPILEIAHLSAVPSALPAPKRNIHKGSRGHVLIVAGSFGMAGAVAFAAGAALRSGAGLVTVACPASIVPILQGLEPCAMCVPLPEADGALSIDAVPPLRALFEGKQVVAVGCGLSRRCAPEILEAILDSRLPSIIDADALNLLSEHRALLHKLHENCVLTPHPGEARRLLGRALTEPLSDARALSAMGCMVVLKGASRVISMPGSALEISATGCSGMAKGGSGDVFTGVLAGLWGLPDLLPSACEIHGLAGILAEKAYGNRGMTARNIMEMLPRAFQCMEKNNCLQASPCWCDKP